VHGALDVAYSKLTGTGKLIGTIDRQKMGTIAVQSQPLGRQRWAQQLRNLPMIALRRMSFHIAWSQVK